MQARRGFILFPFGKPARGLGLIRMRLFKMAVLVIKQGLINNNLYDRRNLRQSFYLLLVIYEKSPVSRIIRAHLSHSTGRQKCPLPTSL